jgi:hypothetical protein
MGVFTMTENRKYPRCNIVGEGTLTIIDTGRKLPFSLVDISGNGVNINLIVEEINVGDVVNLIINLPSNIFEVIINAQAVVKRTNEKSASLEFIKLADSDIEEINGLMMSSCNLF